MNKPLYVKKVKGKGWGVFCTEALRKGKVFERIPVIVIPAKNENTTPKVLETYRFEWGKDAAIALGYASLYNHSAKPNTSYRVNFRSNTISFYALRDIPAGEELTHDYNWEEEYNKNLF